MKKKIISLMNNPKTLIVVLILIIISLLVSNKLILGVHKLYTLNGDSNKIILKNGVLDINTDINYFKGATITINDSTTIKDYKIGYYFKDNKKYIPIVTIGSEEEVKLDNLLYTESFTVYEPHKKALIFTKDNLSKTIVFKIEGKSSKDKTIKYEVELKKIKLSK